MSSFDSQLRALRRRVVVTGTGAVTPIGLSVDETWSALLEGRSGIAPITGFDTSAYPTQFAGQVKGFDIDAYLPKRVSRRVDPYGQYAIAAALQAVEQAKLTIDEELAPKVGIWIGTGYGPSQTSQQVALDVEAKGIRGVSPYSPVTASPDSPTGELSMLLGAQGPNGSCSMACASGTDAIGHALRLIQFGQADVMVVGGAEANITEPDIAGGVLGRSLSRRSDDPTRACRPFDVDRDGFVLASGSGFLVLEEMNRALERGVPILAEIVGYGSTSDAHHWTAPHPEALGARRAIQGALDDAGLTPADVGYINAHGTSTPLNDPTETSAIRQVFGEHATRVPVSSTKSMTGHMIGAAGAFEMVACVQVLNTGIVPPTINCDNPIDPEMNYVPHTPQQHDVRVTMSNSFGFGGHNAVLVAKKWEA
ncbi:3-oxoacyl-[acyl-carrier-protein] synthase II [Crossiella equi]|uniref:3-oxoacyl-[acyl-carrier-protein] synthase 2 n=1 Tax=Crossiella equi TaxID=130796 RepID=A0ABS5A9W4_9PSEU|nr:beta-ketoacyl-ACP synthase II [Crossiella equi]MBP2473366.1 3-oxoacyl-[acyl-carrier-protein] synthase II [Crossiella equi]